MENKIEGKVLTFNKRISLAKRMVFEGVTSSGELSAIKDSKSSGYYSLDTIYKYLYPALDKYDLDIDVIIERKEVIIEWIDCANESIVNNIAGGHTVVNKTRRVVVDFSRLEDFIEKLPLMANRVQTAGALHSYFRRYSLTIILGLPSTDLIDSDVPKTPNTQPRGQQQNHSNKKPNSNPQPAPVVNQSDLKLLKNVLYSAAENDKNVMIKLLETHSSFAGKDGKAVPGINDFDKLTSGRLKATMERVEKEYPHIVKDVKQKLEKKAKT